MEKKQILVVDDDELNLKVAETILGQKYTVWTVNSGVGCISFLLVKKVDLILLDLEMPHMSGLDTLREIRREPRHKDIPVMILTASKSKRDVITTQELSAYDYLVKPYMPDELLRRVENVFEQIDIQEQQRALQKQEQLKQLEVQQKQLEELQKQLQEKQKQHAQDQT